MSARPKRAQARQCENINKTIGPEKHDSSRVESLSSLLEGESAVAKSQRGMTKRMRIITTRQTKEIEKESKKHFVWCNLMYKKVFSFSGKDL